MFNGMDNERLKILVCGSRNWPEEFNVWVYNELALFPVDSIVIHGGAKGADNAAEISASILGMETKCFSADWDLHGKSAGPIRNQQMIDMGQPDVGLAFASPSLEVSRGTLDMVKRLTRNEIPTKVIEAYVKRTYVPTRSFEAFKKHYQS